ncbi:unnamed protein product [Hermetia illucens]|uniref:Uncharacterized protein n=1 Tax=Hermetia illucens TaxID=343691 RepID=A0A7R8V234_HERIL|nr:unnamed protein product [Hermetia illucens]
MSTKTTMHNYLAGIVQHMPGVQQESSYLVTFQKEQVRIWLKSDSLRVFFSATALVKAFGFGEKSLVLQALVDLGYQPAFMPWKSSTGWVWKRRAHLYRKRNRTRIRGD